VIEGRTEQVLLAYAEDMGWDEELQRILALRFIESLDVSQAWASYLGHLAADYTESAKDL
jgi:hypothetical protein